MDQTTTIVLFVVNMLISAVIGGLAAFLTIGVYKNKVDTLEITVGKDEHGGLRKTVEGIKEMVIRCDTSLKEREPLTKKKSPVALTDRGLRFLKDSGAEIFVEQNFQELLEKVEAMVPKTSYDVQEYAKSVVEGLKEDDRLNSIKEFLFKDGSNIDDLSTVMGIYLRDKILKHKGWNVADIDTYSPAALEETG